MCCVLESVKKIENFNLNHLEYGSNAVSTTRRWHFVPLVCTVDIRRKSPRHILGLDYEALRLNTKFSESNVQFQVFEALHTRLMINYPISFGSNALTSQSFIIFIIFLCLVVLALLAVSMILTETLASAGA